MSALESTIAMAVVVAVVVIIVGMCSEGRLKHWLLVALGAKTRTGAYLRFEEIPRPEHNWEMLAPLKGIDKPKR